MEGDLLNAILASIITGGVGGFVTVRVLLAKLDVRIGFLASIQKENRKKISQLSERVRALEVRD